MSVELSILRCFCEDRLKHLVHQHQIEALSEMDKDIKLLFKLVSQYYEENEDEKSVLHEDLLAYYVLKYPKNKNTETIRDLLDTCFSLNININTIDRYLDQVSERYAANEIIQRLLPVIEGDKYGVLSSVREVFDDYDDALHHRSDAEVMPTPHHKDIGLMYEEEDRLPGFAWEDPRLTNIVGPLTPATLGLIYAFVDTGKTSFHMSNVAHFAEQLPDDGRPICICGNEEPSSRLERRLQQAFVKQPQSWVKLIDNKETLERQLAMTNYDRVLIFDEVVSGPQVQYVLKTYQPHILIVDQATDVDIKTKRRADGVEYMKQLFKWYRRLANIYCCAIVGVSQGVGDAENTKWLKLSDIYGSRVAIQGALDYAIGIGRKTDDLALENLRYINIPKNKLHDGDGGHLTMKFTKQNCVWAPA